MFRKSWAAVAACCLVVAATVATASPVSGADDGTPSRMVLRDGSGDVWKVNMRTSYWTLVGDRPAADVRWAGIRHRARAVVVRTRMVDLRRVGVQTYSAGIMTPDDDFFVQVVSRPGRRAGRHTLYDGVAGEPIRCSGLSHRMDYVDDTVTVRVPRPCLGRPRWVRANLGNFLVVGERPHRRHYADNPLNDRPYSNVSTSRIRHAH